MRKNHFLKPFFLGMLALTEVFSLKVSAAPPKKEPEQKKKRGLANKQNNVGRPQGNQVLEQGLANNQNNVGRPQGNQILAQGLANNQNNVGRPQGNQVLEQDNNQQQPDHQLLKSANQILGGLVQFDELVDNPERSETERTAQLVKDYLKFVSFYCKEHTNGLYQMLLKNEKMVKDHFDIDVRHMFHRFLVNSAQQEIPLMSSADIEKKMFELENMIVKEYDGLCPKDIWDITCLFRQKLWCILKKSEHPEKEIATADETFKIIQLRSAIADIKLKYIINTDGKSLWKLPVSPHCMEKVLEAFGRYFNNYQNNLPQILNEKDLIEKIITNSETGDIWMSFFEFASRAGKWNFADPLAALADIKPEMRLLEISNEKASQKNAANQILGKELKFDAFPYDPNRPYNNKKAQLINDYFRLVYFYFKDHKEVIKRLSSKEAEVIRRQFENDARRMFQRFAENGERQAVPLRDAESYKRFFTEEGGDFLSSKDIWDAVSFLERGLSRLTLTNLVYDLEVPNSIESLKRICLDNEIAEIQFKYLISLDGEKLWQSEVSPECMKEVVQSLRKYLLCKEVIEEKIISNEDPHLIWTSFFENISPMCMEGVLHLLRRYYQNDVPQALNDKDIVEKIIAERDTARIWDLFSKNLADAYSKEVFRAFDRCISDYRDYLSQKASEEDILEKVRTNNYANGVLTSFFERAFRLGNWRFDGPKAALKACMPERQVLEARNAQQQLENEAGLRNDFKKEEILLKIKQKQAQLEEQLLQAHNGQQQLENEAGLKNDRQAPKSIEEMLEGGVNFDEFRYDPKRSDKEKEEQLMKDYGKFISFYLKDHVDLIKAQEGQEKQVKRIETRFFIDAARMWQRFLENGESQTISVMDLVDIRNRFFKNQEKDPSLSKDIWDAIGFLQDELRGLLGLVGSAAQIDAADEEAKITRLYHEVGRIGFKHFVDLSGKKVWKFFDRKAFTEDYMKAFQRYFANYRGDLSQKLSKADMLEVKEKIMGGSKALNVWNKYNLIIRRIELENDRKAPKSAAEILGGVLKFDELRYDLQKSERDKVAQLMDDYLMFVSFYFAEERIDTLGNLSQTNTAMIRDQFRKDAYQMFRRFFANGEAEAPLLSETDLNNRMLEARKKHHFFETSIWRSTKLLSEEMNSRSSSVLQFSPQKEESKENEFLKKLDWMMINNIISLDGKKLWKDFNLEDCQEKLRQACDVYIKDCKDRKENINEAGVRIRMWQEEYQPFISQIHALHMRLKVREEQKKLGNAIDLQIDQQAPQFAQKPQVLEQDNAQNKPEQVIESKEKQNLGNAIDLQIGHQAPQFAQKLQVLEQDDQKKENLLQIGPKKESLDEFFAQSELHPNLKLFYNLELTQLIQTGVTFDKLQPGLRNTVQLMKDWTKMLSFYFKDKSDLIKLASAPQARLIQIRFYEDAIQMAERFLNNAEKRGESSMRLDKVRVLNNVEKRAESSIRLNEIRGTIEKDGPLASILLGVEFAKAEIDEWFIASASRKNKKDPTALLFQQLNRIGFKHFVDLSGGKLWKSSFDPAAFNQDIAQELHRYFQNYGGNSVCGDVEKVITRAKDDSVIKDRFNEFMRRIPVKNL